jgi:hypothetical protein
MNNLKRVPDGLARNTRAAVSVGSSWTRKPERDGWCRIGLINDKLKFGLEISYPKKALPRMANWQHYGPRGCYVSALEPFAGSLLGTARDKRKLAQQFLEPGETRNYRLKIRALSGAAELGSLAKHDGPVRPV